MTPNFARGKFHPATFRLTSKAGCRSVASSKPPPSQDPITPLSMNNPTLYPQHAYGQFAPQSLQPAFPYSQAGPQYTEQTPHRLYQQFQQQHAGLARPQSQGHNESGLNQGIPSIPPAQTADLGISQAPRAPTASRADQQPTSQSGNFGSTSPSMLQQRQRMPDPAVAQSGPMQSTPHTTRPAQQSAPPSPPSSREKARVTVLLEINGQLLQEVVSLQAQGKAGLAPSQTQQSPTSPTSAMELNSLADPSKPAQNKPASQEYADCMRRLQANLSYLAAIADAKKKTTSTLPVGPAIMVPPPHLPGVQDLYRKLNGLFPEASQSTINKAMAVASGQAAKGQQALPTPS